MTFDQRYCDEAYIVSSDTRREIVLKDARVPREYRALNSQQKHVLVYKVDGGMVQQGKRCDYALYVSDEQVLLLIELKGGDYSGALSQLMESIEVLVRNPTVTTAQVHARIVLSKTPSPNLVPTAQRKLEKLLKQLNGGLKVQSRSMIELI